MAKIEIPASLNQLLEQSPLQPAIQALANVVGVIVSDNKLAFFPDYSDHGTEHLNCVLKTQVELVPSEVWNQRQAGTHSPLLCDADAVVLIGGTLLHDIAMHLKPAGFLELISRDSRFKPVPWFKESHEGHAADRPWVDLWEDYCREARRFSAAKLGEIIGIEEARGWKFEDLPEEQGKWQQNHLLVIGEFIRRHHARLAHEIAIYGFPGLPAGAGEHQFPAMGTDEGHPLKRYADLIGLTARSHGISLRVCRDYLQAMSAYKDSPRPMDCAVIYHMALLRVADYLQLQRDRAPSVLLLLRDPQSPISINEWRKHAAVDCITPANDPAGVRITVSNSIPLEIYLQMKSLLSGLQEEMDHSTAILSEAYGKEKELRLDFLQLKKRHVYSNLNDPDFIRSLKYVATRTGFSADPNILSLLVKPLYGDEPGIGVRELMQNSIDAVRELHAWCKNHGRDIATLDLPDQEADVLIDFIQRDDNSWFLRVTDKGIGMTSDTIQNYFLRAGASFRQSPDWAKEFVDDAGKPRTIRSGRFGIGAFAIFLLGPSFKLWTRHVGSADGIGYKLEAAEDSSLIEISKDMRLRVGTVVEVDLTADVIEKLEILRGEAHPPTDWYCLNWPQVVRRRTTPFGLLWKLENRWQQLFQQSGHFLNTVNSNNFERLIWNFSAEGRLYCNGIRIGEPNEEISSNTLRFQRELELVALMMPDVNVEDMQGDLPLTIQRNRLATSAPPYLQALTMDVILCFVAHAIVLGPDSPRTEYHWSSLHPLSCDPGFLNRYGRLRWCCSISHFIPADPWLYALLGVESCLVWSMSHRRTAPALFGCLPQGASCAVWSYKENTSSIIKDALASRNPDHLRDTFLALSKHGIEALGHRPKASRILVSLRADEKSWLAGCFQRNVARETVLRSGSQATELHFGASKLVGNLPLEEMMQSWESQIGKQRAIFETLMLAEIQAPTVHAEPESLIAQMWNKLLGPRAIPFDPKARAELVEIGKRDTDLKRHIEKWETFKASGNWPKPSWGKDPITPDLK